MSSIAVIAEPSAGSVVVLEDPTTGNPVVLVEQIPGNPVVLVEQIQGPSGGGPLSVSGVGFIHVTGGTLDGAARAVQLNSADVANVLPVASGGTNLNAVGTVGQVLAVVSPGVLGYEAVPLGPFAVNIVNHASGTVVMATQNDYWCDPTTGSVAVTTPTGATIGQFFCVKVRGVPSGGSPVTITVAGAGSKGLEIPLGEGVTAPITYNTFSTTTLVFNGSNDQGASYVWVSDGANNWYLR